MVSWAYLRCRDRAPTPFAENDHGPPLLQQLSSSSSTPVRHHDSKVRPWSLGRAALKILVQSFDIAFLGSFHQVELRDSL